MKKAAIGILVLFVVVLFAYLATAAEKPAAGEIKHHAVLTGKEEVPPVKTQATGRADFTIPAGAEDIAYWISVSKIENVTGIHIHEGKKGKNGPPVADIYSGPKKEGMLNGVIAEGKITPDHLMGPLKGKTTDALLKLMKAKNCYVNIHTDKFPNGEIRGEIK